LKMKHCHLAENKNVLACIDGQAAFLQEFNDLIVGTNQRVLSNEQA
jgi:hypothetical protein